LLAGLAAQSLIAGSVATSIFTFTVAATMIVILMFVAALWAAFAQASTLNRFKTAGPAVKRWGGRILIVVGAWFLFLAIFVDAAKQLFF
jgi:cytochrome c biogenesis protein CcdA